MPESLRLSVTLPAPPEQIYTAWIKGGKHTAMTGAMAVSEPVVNGQFTAWDGYIWGHYVRLEENRAIVMAWRTSQFPTEAPFSRVEIQLQPAETGSKILLTHTNIPDGQAPLYRDGWKRFYFNPMKRYFSKK